MDARELIQQVNHLLTTPDESGYTHKITAIKLIREHTGLGLVEAKKIADVLSGWTTIRPEDQYTGPGIGGNRPVNTVTMERLSGNLVDLERRQDYLVKSLLMISNAVRDSKTFVEFKKQLQKKEGGA